MNMILLVGHSQVGKDTVGRMIVKASRSRTIAFADPLKDFCRKLFDFSEAQIDGPKEAKNGPDKRYPRAQVLACEHEHDHGSQCFETEYLTPRFAYQEIGMAARRCYSDIWAEFATCRAEAFLHTNHLELVAITDGRFPNEAMAVKARGGEVWKIQRPGFDGTIQGGIDNHPSESMVDSPEMDALVDTFIDNDGTLEDLERKVTGLLNDRCRSLEAQSHQNNSMAAR